MSFLLVVVQFNVQNVFKSRLHWISEMNVKFAITLIINWSVIKHFVSKICKYSHLNFPLPKVNFKLFDLSDKQSETNRGM